MKYSQLFLSWWQTGALCQCGASRGWVRGVSVVPALPAAGGRGAGMCAGLHCRLSISVSAQLLWGGGQQEGGREMFRAPWSSQHHWGAVRCGLCAAALVSLAHGSHTGREGQFLQAPRGRGELRAQATHRRGAASAVQLLGRLLLMKLLECLYLE